MNPHHRVETIHADGCAIVLRRVEGPDATELFFSCQADGSIADAGLQSEAIFLAMLRVLQAEGGSYLSVAAETLFLRNSDTDLKAIRAAREKVLGTAGVVSHCPAISELEQPPLTAGVCLEVLVQAIIPHRHSVHPEQFSVGSSCDCAECKRMGGLLVPIGDESRLYSGALYGSGGDSYEQTLAMFGAAEDLLLQAGMKFSDVMRTWIHFPEMERDYAGFNRARREFFRSREVDPIPASTGIGAGLVAPKHDLCLSIYAVSGGNQPSRTVMSAPTLNEAPDYGSDFSRGMRVEESNRVSLHISGTASIDETGATVHLDDIDAQVDRMLVNVAALLAGQGASFEHVVSAITYLKNPQDAARVQEKFLAAGYQGFPNIMVLAPVCRPELLCETEALAILP